MAMTMKFVHTHLPATGQGSAIPSIEKTIAQSGDLVDIRRLIIGTTEESVTFSADITEGYVWIENLDATNFVQIGVTTAVYFARLKAGEAGWFRLEPGVTLFCKADSAPVNVEFRCYDD